jgi:hypothetical protein
MVYPSVKAGACATDGEYRMVQKETPINPIFCSISATTWAVVHYTRFNKSLTYNFSEEIIEQVEEHRENMKLRQAALEATGKYS